MAQQGLSHSCIPGPTTPEPNLVEAAALSLKINPTKTSQTEISQECPKPNPFPFHSHCCAAFPRALVGFIAFHLLSHLCSEHFCPRLFVLGLFQDSQGGHVGSGSTSHPPCSPTERRHRAGCSPCLLSQPHHPPQAHEGFGCLRDCATLQSLSHLQPGKLRHGMHTEGLGSLVANQCHWGQAQGWPHLAPTSFPWSCGTGDIGDVAGDRCPTRAAHTHQRHGNRRCPRAARPATCSTLPALFPGLPTPLSHPGDVNTAPPALWQLQLLMERRGATCSLLGCWGGSRSDPAGRSWEKSIPNTGTENLEMLSAASAESVCAAGL